jgi:hypothetical protein
MPEACTMISIRWSRVLAGGLLAGLIINLSGLTLAHFFLGPEYIEAFKAKFPPSSETAMAVQHLSLRFWFGIVAVFLYAAMRPRFGPGPRTALIAGATFFLSVGIVMLMSVRNLGLLSGGMLLLAGAWSFCEMCIGALVGAWVYRE